MFICLLAISLLATCQAAYLTTTGTSFYYNRQKIFLSGYNIAWYDFGNDFGTSKYFGGSDYKGKLVKYLDQVKNAGGNAVRKLYIHLYIMGIKKGTEQSPFVFWWLSNTTTNTFEKVRVDMFGPFPFLNTVTKWHAERSDINTISHFPCITISVNQLNRYLGALWWALYPSLGHGWLAICIGQERQCRNQGDERFPISSQDQRSVCYLCAV